MPLHDEVVIRTTHGHSSIHTAPGSRIWVAHYLIIARYLSISILLGKHTLNSTWRIDTKKAAPQNIQLFIKESFFILCNYKHGGTSLPFKALDDFESNADKIKKKK